MLPFICWELRPWCHIDKGTMVSHKGHGQRGWVASRLGGIFEGYWIVLPRGLVLGLTRLSLMTI